MTSLTDAQYSSAVAAKLVIATPANAINVTEVSAARAVTLGKDDKVATLTVSDTAANVMGNLGALQTAKFALSNAAPISLSDATSASITLTANTWNGSQAVLGKIANLATADVTVTGAAATDVVALAQSGKVDHISLATGLTTLTKAQALAISTNGVTIAGAPSVVLGAGETLSLVDKSAFAQPCMSGC